MVAVYAVPAAAGQGEPSISTGWVKLPATGATSAEAYVTVRNPTMYDVDLQGATSDAAATVELRQAGRETALPSVTISAYGALEMEDKGVYLLLKELKQPLAEGDKVKLTISTDTGTKLTVTAAVRRE